MKLSRRSLLASFLGLPAAITACRSTSPPTPIPGELVGGNATFGHLLRDGPRLNPAPDAWQDLDVGIVGAGASGLSAAWRLAREPGLSFLLLELEAEAGGTARSGRNEISAFPWGAHYLPVPLPHSRALITLLTELGLVEGVDDRGHPRISEEHLVRDPEERHFFLGRWWPGVFPHVGETLEDQRQLEAFLREVRRWVGWRDGRGRRAFTIPVSRCSDDPDVTVLDREPFSEWLDRRGLTSSRLRWTIDYACRDDYGLCLEQCSAWAGLFYFAARTELPGEESAGLLTWPEGNGRLIAGLRARVGDRIRTRMLVSEIRPGAAEDDRIEVVALDEATGRPTGFRVRKVIFSAPLFLARHLIRPFRDEVPGWSNAFTHSPWMVANLSLRGRPRQVGFPLCWDNVLVDSPSLGYVTATHQALRDHGPTVLTYYYPLTGPEPGAERRRLLELGQPDWVDIILSDLSRAHPDLREHLERVDVMRWGHAMVRPVPGLIWGGARQAAVQPFRGIHLAHTDLSGVALFEEAHDHGVRAAEEVLLALGRPGDSLR